MDASFSVPLGHVIREFTLEQVYMPSSPADLFIESANVNRPGMQLAGFFKYYDAKRIQVLGRDEYGFLDAFTPEKRQQRVGELLERKPPAVIITRGLPVLSELLGAAHTYSVPILRTEDTTSAFIAALISYLNVQLAPRITRHGVLVEVYGEGVLILGDSGVGKSETAIELIKRGHRLIADDAVEIRRVSSKTLVGSAPDNIRHFIELRGIGIINARRIFGMGSVKLTEKIDMVLSLEIWDGAKIYDRMGLENEMTTILGLEIPSVTIPVKPGRNLAVIIEVAAMNNRQKKMGFNAAQELLQRLGMAPEEPEPKKNETDWSAF